MALHDASSTAALRLVTSGSGTHTLSGSATAELQIVGSGDVFDVAYISTVVVLSSTQLRLTFNKSVDNSLPLSVPANFAISGAVGEVLPSVLSVVVGDSPAVSTIDLVISEMKEGAAYGVAVVSSEITRGGVEVAADVVGFTGQGVAPAIFVVVAMSATTAQVRFTEALRDGVGLRTPASYVFDNGLAVEEFISHEQAIVTLRTSEQDPAILYGVTVTATIVDNAGNLMVSPAASQMLGFQPPSVSVEPLQLKMYNFLPAHIREEDQRGTTLLQRFLEGPQEIWQDMNRAILGIPSLWNLEEIPAPLLQYQEPLLGWSGELAEIPASLDDVSRRRLDGASVAFWKARGPEDTIEDIIRLVTGARAQVFNYFDFRWVVGETHFGEEHDVDDPWLIENSPFATAPVTLGATVTIADSGPVSPVAIAMGENDGMIVLLAVRDGRQTTSFQPSPVDSLTFGTTPLNFLGSVRSKNEPSGSEIFLAAYWLRGIAEVSDSLGFSIAADPGGSSFAFRVEVQAVNAFSSLKISLGRFSFAVLSQSDSVESTIDGQAMSLCAGTGGPMSVGADTEERAGSLTVAGLTSIYGSRASTEGHTVTAFANSIAGTMGQLSVFALGAPDGLRSGGEQVYHVRVVDDGTLDQALVRKLCAITKPSNERVDILYTGFLDRFIVPDDKSQWTDELGVSAVAVNEMSLPGTAAIESIYASVTNAVLWSDYVVTWRAKGGTSFDLVFYRATEENHYFLRITTDLTSPNGRGRLELFQRVAAVDTSIASVDLPEGYLLQDELYHSFRIEIVRTGATNAIQAIIDADVVLSVTNSAHTAGSIGMRRQDSTSGGAATFDDVELFFLPAQTDFIGINE